MRTRATRTPPALCLHCGYQTDAASPAQGRARPREGDWMLCLRCAGLMVFDKDLRPLMPPFGAYEALRLTEPETYAKLELGRATILELSSKGDWIPDKGHRA
jgi:hypothetical protein